MLIWKRISLGIQFLWWIAIYPFYWILNHSKSNLLIPCPNQMPNKKSAIQQITKNTTTNEVNKNYNNHDKGNYHQHYFHHNGWHLFMKMPSLFSQTSVTSLCVKASCSASSTTRIILANQSMQILNLIVLNRCCFFRTSFGYS